MAINPVSGNYAQYAKAEKPGFCDNFGWVTRYLQRNPVSGDYAQQKNQNILDISSPNPRFLPAENQSNNHRNSRTCNQNIRQYGLLKIVIARNEAIAELIFHRVLPLGGS